MHPDGFPERNLLELVTLVLFYSRANFYSELTFRESERVLLSLATQQASCEPLVLALAYYGTFRRLDTRDSYLLNQIASGVMFGSKHRLQSVE